MVWHVAPPAAFQRTISLPFFFSFRRRRSRPDISVVFARCQARPPPTALEARRHASASAPAAGSPSMFPHLAMYHRACTASPLPEPAARVHAGKSHPVCAHTSLVHNPPPPRQHIPCPRIRSFLLPVPRRMLAASSPLPSLLFPLFRPVTCHAAAPERRDKQAHMHGPCPHPRHSCPARASAHPRSEMCHDKGHCPPLHPPPSPPSKKNDQRDAPGAHHRHAACVHIHVAPRLPPRPRRRRSVRRHTDRHEASPVRPPSRRRWRCATPPPPQTPSAPPTAPRRPTA